MKPDGQLDSRTGETRADTPIDGTPAGRCTTLQLGATRLTRDGIIVDVDKDGRLDIVTAEFDGHTAVFRQTAPRSFADPDVFDLPDLGEASVAAADLNEDGVIDFAAGDSYGRVGLLISGAGGVRSPTIFSGGVVVLHLDIAIADFDRNGHMDIVVPVYDNGTLGFLWDNGPGTFLPRADQPTCKAPSQIAVIDANEDGLPDLAVACLGSASAIHINNGDRTFTSAGLYTTSAAEALATGDINNDGHIDVVIADTGYKRVVVLLGDGHGGFSQPTGLVTATKTNPSRAALGDFNHDGNLDLVLGHREDRQVFIYLGTGDGHFQSGQPTAIPITQAAISISAGDIDGDGYDDFVATNLEKGLTVVFGPCP